MLRLQNLNKKAGSDMNKRRKHGFRTGVFLLWTFLVLLVIAGIALGICIHLALQDDYKNKYSFYQSDETLMYTALKGAVFGEAFSLTETQVNTYVNNEIVKNSNNNIKNLRIYLKNNNMAEIYARINYMNHDFALYSKARLSLDTVSNTISVHLYDAKLGNLSVPDFILKDTINKNVVQTDNVSVKDGIIYVRSSFNFDISSFILNLTFQKFAIGENTVICQTNSLAEDALSVLTAALKTAEGRQRLSELFKSNFTIEDIKNFKLDGLEKLIPDLRDLEDIKDKIISRFSDNL